MSKTSPKSPDKIPVLSLPFGKDGRAGPPHVVILGAGASVAAWEDWGRVGRRPLLTKELFDIEGVQGQFEDAGFGRHNDDFEATYSDLADVAAAEPFAVEIQRLIRAYFDGLSLPDLPTMYDYLILALRPKDVIATFNWDPYLREAYRRCLSAFDYRDVLPRIHFLHGNVRVGSCKTCRKVGWTDQRCEACSRLLEPSKLLYPVKRKHYSDDPLLHSEWTMTSDELKQAYMLTVFGYAAPATDVEAKQLLLDGWKEGPLREMAQIEIVNVEDKETSLEKWNDFIVRDHAWHLTTIEDSWLYKHPRRTCDALWAATQRLSPMSYNPYPKFDDLAQLWEWIAPLLKLEPEASHDGGHRGE